MSGVAPEYAAARAVLLDALDAIGAHREAVILVGAQAVYLHTGQGDLAVALMTTDSDLAVRASVLGADPDLACALRAGSFVPGRNPGEWCGRGDVRVDIMVVPHESNRPQAGARAARLPRQNPAVARITAGLEPALVDHAPEDIAALDPDDRRRFTLAVAGPAALVSAKAIKLAERYQEAQAGKRDRTTAKDALDVFRLLQVVEPADLRAGFARHAEDAHARPVSAAALTFLRSHGTSAAGRLAQLAADELGEQWWPTPLPACAGI